MGIGFCLKRPAALTGCKRIHYQTDLNSATKTYALYRALVQFVKDVFQNGELGRPVHGGRRGPQAQAIGVIQKRVHFRQIVDVNERDSFSAWFKTRDPLICLIFISSCVIAQ